MRIVLATFGSLGDLHPSLALARELRDRGHAPVVATFDVYREAVGEAGVEFAAMRPSAEALGDRREIMARLLDPRHGPEFLMRQLFMPHLRESYEDLDGIAADADILVSHPITFAAPLVAEKRALPWASTVLSPLSLMSACDPPALPGAGWLRAVRRLGVAPYRMLFSLAKRMAARWERPVHELRRELGLPARGLAQFEGQYSPRLNLALFSPLIAAPQPDWPPHTVTCGFARYDGRPAGAAERSALEAFLAAGEAPLVFGLGSSAVAVAERFWSAATDAVERLGVRAIFLVGKDAVRLPRHGASVAAFDYLPYSLVFPHARAVVHTCGIGTLAQALTAGRPQLIVPLAFDQPDNARRAAQLGVGRVLPFRDATADRLADALDRVLCAPAYARKAAGVSTAIARENGSRAACDALERLAAR